MANDIFKTKFSLNGLVAALLVFAPYIFIWLPAKRIFFALSAGPGWLLVIYMFTALALTLTLSLVRNISAPPFSRKSRLISIAYIFLGIYYIFIVYFFIKKPVPYIFLMARIAVSGFFIFFSLDRKNWISLSFSILFFILGLSISAIALVGIYG